MPEKTSQKIKVGSVTLHAYEWVKPGTGATYWRAIYHDPETGKRKYITRADKRDLVKDARTKAREIHNGSLELSSLSPEQVRLCRAFLDLDPDWSTIERLKAEQEREAVTLTEALDRFISIKQANAGNSPHNVYTLKKRIGHLVPTFGATPIDDIKVDQLDQWLAAGTWAASTKRNTRAAIVTLFRWCRSQGYLPDQTTAAERMARPIVIKSAPSTFTPEELEIMLDAVSGEFLPWLAISSWAGVRREEMYPATKSKKDCLRWEDVDLERNLIIIRREVSKTNERRVIPICPALSEVLAPLHKSTGRVTGKTGPSDRKNKKAQAETKRLGDLVGGWKNNALRHSFVSYRCAQVGVAAAAMEAGNSESETRRSYRDAMSQEDAEAWFRTDP